MAEFWQRKSLAQMNESEWESLCDGCARCCMIKLQDEETDEVHYTALVCDLLDIETCRCSRYPQRHELVPDCVELTAQTAATFGWLPVTCAYRTLAEGRPLPDWHPLVSGDPDSVHQAGISVRGKVVPQAAVHSDEQDTMVVSWVEQ